MATLTLSVSALSSAITATDENAQEILELVWERFHPNEYLADYTAQERLNSVAQICVEALVSMARQQAERNAVTAAHAAIAAEPPAWNGM